MAARVLAEMIATLDTYFAARRVSRFFFLDSVGQMNGLRPTRYPSDDPNPFGVWRTRGAGDRETMGRWSFVYTIGTMIIIMIGIMFIVLNIMHWLCGRSRLEARRPSPRPISLRIWRSNTDGVLVQASGREDVTQYRWRVREDCLPIFGTLLLTSAEPPKTCDGTGWRADEISWPPHVPHRRSRQSDRRCWSCVRCVRCVRLGR